MDLAKEFQNRHGYDLIPHLDALFGGTSIASQMTRLHYFQTVGDVMASNFSGQIAQWCHKNDVQSSGHFLLEEYLACHVVSYGNFMKVMRNFDIPSCDLPIARPGNVYWKFWMPRSEEQTSELQSLMRISYAVFCLKKKKAT